MKQNTVYLMECGGGIGCTEKLHMPMVDFMLVLNDKHYRFDMTNGNLSILCINGVDEKIGVKNGYKNLVITKQDDSWSPYEKGRSEYLQAIEEAKQNGCKECPFRVDSPVYKMCGKTGEDFWNGVPEQSNQCPFN